MTHPKLDEIERKVKDIDRRFKEKMILMNKGLKQMRKRHNTHIALMKQKIKIARAKVREKK